MATPQHDGSGHEFQDPVEPGEVEQQADLDALIVAIYDEVRRVAHQLMSGEAPGNTLQPTALAHEAIARVYDAAGVCWTDHHHVLAVLVTTMRRTLVDRARKRRAAKRGGAAGEHARVPIESVEPVEIPAIREFGEELLEPLGDAIDRLAKDSADLAAIAYFKQYTKLSMPHIAKVMDKPVQVVERDWRFVRSRLRKELLEQVGDHPSLQVKIARRGRVRGRQGSDNAGL